MLDTKKDLLAFRDELAASIGSCFSTYNECKLTSKNKKSTQKYAKLNNIIYLDEKFYISGEILTDDLLLFDERYISEEHNRIIKPIIWGFETKISLDSLWHASNGLTIKMKEYLEKDLKVSFSNYKNLKSQLEALNKEDGLNERIFEPLYNNLIYINFQSAGGYYSLVYFSASPFVQEKKYIKFLDGYKNYDNNNFDNLYEKLSELEGSDVSEKLKSFTPYKLNEYNVGQGNFSELLSTGNYPDIIVFDPGFTYLDDHNNFWGAKKELERLRAECYFISHFDLDHILGTIYLQNSQFSKRILWVSPDPISKYTSCYAKRLIKFLHENAKFRIIKKISNDVFDFNKKIKIYKGTGSPSDINNTGIMISASGTHKTALLPGDCLYQKWSSKVVSSHEYDYLIAPHHGCKINKTDTISIKANRNAKVIVPVGKKQKNYHHPNLCHLEKLDSIGFEEIYLTTDLNTPINISSVTTGKHGEINLNKFPDKSPKDCISLNL